MDIIHRDINGVRICNGDTVIFASNKGSRDTNCQIVKTVVLNQTKRIVQTKNGGTMTPEDRIMILDGEFVSLTKTKDHGKG
jgi:hypothetical protein|tara:strand:- start:263 stop:505 length:243 start_codon:yes stop_codon:yes gene_type:complete